MPDALSPVFPDVVPELTDGVVTLRAHRQSDVPDIVGQCNDPESVRFTTVPQPYGVQDAQLFIGTIVPGGWADEFGTRMWAIEAEDADGIPRFAGSVDYRPTPDGVAEIGFGLHPWARGQRVMSRAVRLVIGHAFEHGVETLHWRAHVGNWGSWRVAWSCGFRQEATVRDLLPQRGERRDGWIGTLRKGESLVPRTRWLEIPVLEGDRVRLRPWREDDAPAADRVLDGASQRFMPGFVPTAETFEEWLHTQRGRASIGDSVVWCIADVDTDEPLGNINVFRLNFQLMAGSGMVGYWLHPEGRGRGAMAEALELAVGHAFAAESDGGLGLHRLEAGTDIGNRTSQRALRRAGFVQIGHEHEAMAHSDGPTDGLHFELLRSADREAQRVVPIVPATLTTEHLRLREWRESDRPRPDQLLDPDSARFMPAGAKPDPDTFDGWLARKRREMDAGTAVHWCIADADSDDALGCLQVFRIGAGSPGNAEVGYWLHTQARGRGVLGEALAAGIDHAFTPTSEGGLGLRRLHAATDLANVASQVALRRAGFRTWGVDHQSYARSDGSISDGAFVELLADDHRNDGRGPRTGASHAAPRGHAVLSSEQLRLRPFDEGDAPALAMLMRHDDFGRSADSTADEAVARRWLSGALEAQLFGRALQWAVTMREDDAPVGYLTAFRLDDAFHHDGCEIGYWLAPEARGRGLAQEAVRLLLAHVFAPPEAGGLGLRRVRAITSPENLASRSVLRACGFRLWGVEPEAVAPGSFGGQRTDGQGDQPSPDRLQLSITRDAWAEGANASHPSMPLLEGDGVSLRPWRQTDAPRVQEACSDPRTRHWLDGLPGPYTLADAGAFIARAADRTAAGRDIFWCITDQDSDECLGSLTVHAASGGDAQGASVGYWAHPTSRGRGITSAALRLAVAHAFRSREAGGLGLPRLSLVAADGNTASQHVARAAGFRRSGVDRASDRLGDGSVVDWVRFDLLPGDLERTALPETVTIEGPTSPGAATDIRLRGWRADDIPRIVVACTDPVTRHWLAALPDPYDESTALGYLEMTEDRQREGSGLFWCVADGDSDACLGSLGLMDLRGEDPTCAEVGYWLHPDARGRGAMRQAVGLAVRHAFLPVDEGGLGLRRLRLNVADGNEASARIAHAHGFTEVGRDRAAERLGDASYVDLRRFDLLAAEWGGA